jgi:hypothetical protein
MRIWRYPNVWRLDRLFPGGTVGYPADPKLIRLSVRQIRFNYSAENRLGPTNLVKYSLENVN